jgi:hypothetical protein
VRAQVKTIYEKSNVSSRGERVATLFTNHVINWLHDPVTAL